MSKNGLLAASGYRPYDYLSSPIFVDKFLADYYPESLVTKLTTSVVEGTSVRYGQEYVFKKSPKAEWFSLRKNQQMEASELTIDTVTMNIGRASGFLLKVDDLDRMSIDGFNDYVTAWRNDAKQKLAQMLDRNIINAMAHGAAACNKGNAAGVKFGNYQLGITGSPLTVNKDNILNVLMYLGIILDEQNAPKQGRFVVLPPEAKIALMTHPLFMSQCSSGSKPLVLADSVPSIAGFDLYFPATMPSYNDPSGKIAYPIIAGVKEATYFALGMQDFKAGVEDAKSWGVYWKGRAVYDWKVIRPEFLAVAYATVQI